MLNTYSPSLKAKFANSEDTLRSLVQFPMGTTPAERKTAKNDPHHSTREVILSAALLIAAEKGFSSVNRKMIADRTGKVRGVVNHHFGNLEQLRETIMIEAIRQKHMSIIVQMVTISDPVAKKIVDNISDVSMKQYVDDIRKLIRGEAAA